MKTIVCLVIAGCMVACSGIDRYPVEKSGIPLFGLGSPATDSLVRIWDTDAGPDGQGLPPGSGNAVEGKTLFTARCASCHGAGGSDATFGQLAATSDTAKGKTIGNYWPYATTVFDYIRRAMPFDQPGSLTNNEVYALTAYILAQNRIIHPDSVMHAGTLQMVQMPAKEKFVPDDRSGGKEVK